MEVKEVVSLVLAMFVPFVLVWGGAAILYAIYRLTK
jgi:hypothetical protein